MQKIYLSGKKGKDQFVLVNNKDYKWLNQWKWNLSVWGYAVRSTYIDKKRGSIKMHRLILNAPNNVQVDHKNQNRLDNRRENLRLCTHQENKFNTKLRDDNTSGYKGVSFCKGYRKKWVAQIQYNNKHIILGRFDNKIDAAKAYNIGAKKLFGEFALFNFQTT